MNTLEDLEQCIQNLSSRSTLRQMSGIVGRLRTFATGGRINEKVYGCDTLLHTTVKKDNHTLVQELLNVGADYKVCNNYNENSLDVAIKNNNMVLVEMMIGHKYTGVYRQLDLKTQELSTCRDALRVLELNMSVCRDSQLSENRKRTAMEAELKDYVTDNKDLKRRCNELSLVVSDLHQALNVVEKERDDYKRRFETMSKHVN